MVHKASESDLPEEYKKEVDDTIRKIYGLFGTSSVTLKYIKYKLKLKWILYFIKYHFRFSMIFGSSNRPIFQRAIEKHFKVKFDIVLLAFKNITDGTFVNRIFFMVGLDVFSVISHLYPPRFPPTHPLPAHAGRRR